MLRQLFLGLVCSVAIVVGWTASAAAGGDTYKRVVCSPDDYDDEQKEKCLFKFKLKKLQTKEFRGHCADASGNTSKPKNQDCRKNNSANSYTTTFDPSQATASSGYLSCSCTNWYVTNSHNVKVMINC